MSQGGTALLNIFELMEVYKRIKQFREAKNLSQSLVADSIGIAYQNYWKIENGKTELTVSRLSQIAKVLEVSVFELLNQDEHDLLGLFRPDIENKLCVTPEESLRLTTATAIFCALIPNSASPEMEINNAFSYADSIIQFNKSTFLHENI